MALLLAVLFARITLVRSGNPVLVTLQYRLSLDQAQALLAVPAEEPHGEGAGLAARQQAAPTQPRCCRAFPHRLRRGLCAGGREEGFLA